MKLWQKLITEKTIRRIFIQYLSSNPKIIPKLNITPNFIKSFFKISKLPQIYPKLSSNHFIFKIISHFILHKFSQNLKRYNKVSRNKVFK